MAKKSKPKKSKHPKELPKEPPFVGESPAVAPESDATPKAADECQPAERGQGKTFVQEGDGPWVEVTPPAETPEVAPPVDCKPERVELPLPVHPDSPECPDLDGVEIVHKPLEPSDHPLEPLPSPVKLTHCHVAVWDIPGLGRYVILAVPPGAELDDLQDGQRVDVDLNPGAKW
jgi:hypothetical protein